MTEGNEHGVDGTDCLRNCRRYGASCANHLSVRSLPNRPEHNGCEVRTDTRQPRSFTRCSQRKATASAGGWFTRRQGSSGPQRRITAFARSRGGGTGLR